MAKTKVVHSFGSKANLSPTVQQVAWGSAIAMALCALAVSSIGILALIWGGLPLLPPLEGRLPTHLKSWLAIGLNNLSASLFAGTANDYRRFLSSLAASGEIHLLYLRVGLALGISIPLGCWVLKRAARPSNGIMHTDGRRLEDDELTAVQKENARLAFSIEKLGGDLHIHPKIQYTMEQFSRQTLVFGAIGGGKTTIIMFLLHQIFAQNHKAIIYDNKGEMAAQFPQASLLAPWQKGSLAWDIARDCQTRQDAQLFAAQCIPEGKENPMWSNAARQVMVGLIVSLQVTKPLTWGWQDLADVITTGMDDLLPLMERYNPEAISIAESQNQTTYGVLISMRAGLSWISDMAQAWGNPAPGAGISFVDWIYDDDCAKHRQIMLQGNGRFEQMMRGYVSSIIALMVSHINSPKFKRSRVRKMWFILDEFIQLGKLHFMPLVEIGRGKGVRSVFGVQSVEQITEVYGANLTASLLSMIGTKVVCQIAPGETAKKISEMIGSRDVERENVSISSQAGGGSTTRTINRDKIDVIHESRLSTDLGNRPELGAIVALLINIDSPYVLMLPWPHDKTPEARDSYIEADWVSNSVSKNMSVGGLQTDADAPTIEHEEELRKRATQASIASQRQLERQASAALNHPDAPTSIPSHLIQKKAAVRADEISDAFRARRQSAKQTGSAKAAKARDGGQVHDGEDGHSAQMQPPAPNETPPPRAALEELSGSGSKVATTAAEIGAATLFAVADGGSAAISGDSNRTGSGLKKLKTDLREEELAESKMMRPAGEHQDNLRHAEQLAKQNTPEEKELDAMGLEHARKMGDALGRQVGLPDDVAGVAAIVALAPLILDAGAAERSPTKEEMRLVLAQRRERLLQMNPERDG